MVAKEVSIYICITVTAKTNSDQTELIAAMHKSKECIQMYTFLREKETA